jgi:hypothetical protein
MSMKNMKLSSKAFIIHDASGQIVSVGRVPANVKGKLEVKIDREGYSVLEVELDRAQAAMRMEDLLGSHQVDIASRRLVKK